MKILLLLLLATSCASKNRLATNKIPEPEESFYLLYADRMECGITKVNGIDLSPRRMMTIYPRCQMEMKANDHIKLYLLDCTQEKAVGNVLIYTKDIESCVKTKYILEELQAHPHFQEYRQDISL